MPKIWRKAIEKKDVKDKGIASWWKEFLIVCPSLISDWVKKETYWLRENIKKGSIVLDVWCGWGEDLKAIAKIIKKGIGIDNDPEITKIARRNVARFKNIEVFLKDAKKWILEIIFLIIFLFWEILLEILAKTNIRF